jgi:class 3 adenylate cyclase
VGVHSGFVIGGNPDELLGRNVVLATRIAAYAKAGEIVVSSTLKEYTESDPSFHFEPRGEHHFKGLLGEHTVYTVRWR